MRGNGKVALQMKCYDWSDFLGFTRLIILIFRRAHVKNAKTVFY